MPKAGGTDLATIRTQIQAASKVSIFYCAAVYVRNETSTQGLSEYLCVPALPIRGVWSLCYMGLGLSWSVCTRRR